MVCQQHHAHERAYVAHMENTLNLNDERKHLFMRHDNRKSVGTPYYLNSKTIMAKTNNKTAPRKKASESQTKEESDSMLLDLFVDGIKDIYWAEKHLAKALPKMQKAATTTELQDAFETHLEQTEEQVVRLEKVFELLEEKAAAKKCDAMEGLLKEAQSIIEETEEGTATRDVGLIIAAQKVEHYEIASYGSLATLAKSLGRDDIARLLIDTLKEEEATDELLTGIAENSVNYEASGEVQES